MTTTDSNNTPKTIGLPPEPPVGTEWLDCSGNQWRHEPEGWTLWGGTTRHAWSAVCRHLPLTLVEPDPWPTAPLIVATFLDKRCVFGRTEDGNYDSPTGGLEADADFHRDTLINVVPVTVVPTAPLPVLWSALEQWLNGHSDPDAATNKLVGAVVGLREQIEELGLEPEPEPPVGTTIIDNRGVTWTHTEPGLWVTETGAQGRYNNIVSNFGPVARSRQGQFLGCESPELEALKRAYDGGMPEWTT